MTLLISTRDLLPLDKGWTMLDHLYGRTLDQREEVTRYWEVNPPGAAIVKPVVIVGAYRTGTTALHRGLAQLLPNYRTLLGWESDIQVPPARNQYTDPRGQAYDEIMQGIYDRDHQLKMFHDESAFEPAECVRAMAMTGLTGLWPAMAYTPLYVDWLLSEDAVSVAMPAYEFYDACLRTLRTGLPLASEVPDAFPLHADNCSHLAGGHLCSHRA